MTRPDVECEIYARGLARGGQGENSMSGDEVRSCTAPFTGIPKCTLGVRLKTVPSGGEHKSGFAFKKTFVTLQTYYEELPTVRGRDTQRSKS